MAEQENKFEGIKKPERLFSNYERLEVDFLNALEHQDEKDICKLQERFNCEFNEDLEGVKVLFGFRKYALAEKRLLDFRQGQAEEISSTIYKELTEYEFTIVDYLIKIYKRPEEARNLWSILEKMSKVYGIHSRFEQFKRGVIGQVTVYKILEKLGRKPQLSSPEEDAYRAIDLWSYDDTAVQIKTSIHITEPVIIGISEAEEIAFPVVRVKDEQKNYEEFYNSKFFQETRRFKTKLNKYAHKVHKNLKGYLIIVPIDEKYVDLDTGEPKPSLVEFFGKIISR